MGLAKTMRSLSYCSETMSDLQARIPCQGCWLNIIYYLYLYVLYSWVEDEQLMLCEGCEAEYTNLSEFCG